MNENMISYDEMNNRLASVFAEFENISSDINVNLSRFTDTGKTVYDIFNPIGSRAYLPINVVIGTKTLQENMTDGYVRDKDFIWMMWQAYHELDHVDMLYHYMRKEQTLDVCSLAKYSVYEDYFRDYKNAFYVVNPCELHAEKYAISRLKMLAEDMHLDIDDICAEKVNSDEYGFITSEVSSVHEIMNALDKNYNKSFYVLKSGFLYNQAIATEELVMSVLNCEDGNQEIETCCQYIAKHDPKYFRAYQCIKEDYCKDTTIKGKIENFTSKKILHIVPQEFEDITSNVEDQESDEFEG